ncbi:shugoshin-1 isoform X1 [Hevea brasiliensis]|uniref:shugoshin-1 isoform X1 n=1 Tax=Hevea brasiliensis TaxID=3981 RepID=UPI0025DD2789|nr:shugoshin-1 isoform X1 [Hevea brasiliensis]
MKGERMVKRSSFGRIVRKRLSDITNSQSQHKLVSLEEKQPPIPNSTDDLINLLLKEKAALMQLIEERNKIIALSDNRLRNLRMHYQKLQLQNWNLAQSNSQMLAVSFSLFIELNLGREKLKALQHEVVCKDALLKAKNLEQAGKADIKYQSTGFQEVEKNMEGQCLNKANNNRKPGSRIRRHTARSRSMGPSTTSKQGLEKEKLENKKRCLRRQSARFKSHEREPMQNLFEIEDAKFPITRPLDSPMQEDGLITQSGSSVVKEETFEPGNEAHVAQRSSLGRPVRRAVSSLGRPVRRAVEKVQSYKEVPLNTKMRR